MEKSFTPDYAKELLTKKAVESAEAEIKKGVLDGKTCVPIHIEETFQYALKQKGWVIYKSDNDGDCVDIMKSRTPEPYYDRD